MRISSARKARKMVSLVMSGAILLSNLFAPMVAYTKETFIRDKVELMQALFAIITRGDITPQEKSIIARCTRLVFKNIDFELGRNQEAPTLVDFARILTEQSEPCARDLVLALEQYVTEPMDMFAKHTNVNITDKKLIVFGLADLGEEQKSLGILFLLDLIRSKIAENFAKKIATYLYIDEFHVLSVNEYAAYRLYKIWKEVRKWGALCTGATQQIADLIQSQQIATMLSNSEFLCLLSMGDAEIDVIKHIFELPDTILEYVRNSEPGMGILKFGPKVIPRDGRLNRNGAIYDLFNTNFHEKNKKMKGRE